jgi:hypothetical protein
MLQLRQDKTILSGYHVFFRKQKKGTCTAINSSSNTYKYSLQKGYVQKIYPFGFAVCFVGLNKSDFS